MTETTEHKQVVDTSYDESYDDYYDYSDNYSYDYDPEIIDCSLFGEAANETLDPENKKCEEFEEDGYRQSIPRKCRI